MLASACPNGKLEKWFSLHPEKGKNHDIKSFVFQWLHKYSAKVGALSVFSDVAPNHVLVNEYEPGQGIMVRRNTSVEKSVCVCFFKIFTFPWARVLWNLPVICAGFSLAWVAWRFVLHTTERGSLKSARKVRENERRPQSSRSFIAPSLPCLHA